MYDSAIDVLKSVQKHFSNRVQFIFFNKNFNKVNEIRWYWFPLDKESIVRAVNVDMDLKVIVGYFDHSTNTIPLAFYAI